ncbi:MAG: alpha-E domain-containing protein [Acetobacteraceae bacterium]|nr:alpha-E domain-containing protein [Acetobacteraceae bacterium]
MSDTLLSRYAECIFWLARYVERAENLARILDVNETFARDRSGEHNWLPIVQLNADETRFFARHQTATSQAVLQFYVTDADNPTSIVSAVKGARENARTLRPLISTEMWVHLNKFHSRMTTLRMETFGPGQLTGLFSEIKEACQTHVGITEGTFYRDQGWYFSQIGRYLERADQTTRLLDIKYHSLLPSVSDVGSPIDASQWNALLRSAAGYHAFLRMHSSGLTPGKVAGFLLLNRRFPRSVYLCIRQVETLLTELKSRYMLRGGSRAAETLDSLRAVMGSRSIQSILAQGLHEFLDGTQRHLISVTNEIASDFFSQLPETAEMDEPVPVRTVGGAQSQVQVLGR